MTTLYDELDVDLIPSVPDDGSHGFLLKKMDKSVAPWDEKTYLVFDFVLNEEGSPFNGSFKLRKRFWLPTADEANAEPDKAIKAVNGLRAWLRGMGVAEENLKAPDFEALVDIRYDIYGRGYDGSQGRAWGGNNIKVAE